METCIFLPQCLRHRNRHRPRFFFLLQSRGERSGLDANTLLAENVEHELSGPVVLVYGLASLEGPHILEVLVEKVRAVHRSTLSLGVELGREDGASLVDHALVAPIVEVDEVLLEVAGEGLGVDGITVVLAGDVALAGGQVEGGDVVGAVSVLELDGAGTDGEGEELVAEADAHDGDLGGVHEAGEVVRGLLAVDRVAGAVGDEDTVKVGGDLVDGVVVGEDGDGGTSADEAAKDVLLDTAVDQGNVELGAGGLDNEGGLGANPLDEVDLARVEEGLILIGVVLLTDGDPGERRTLLSEVSDDGTGVNAGDGGHTLTGAPLAQALDCSPVAVLLGDVGDDDTGALNVGGLEVLEKVVVVSFVRRHTVVADQGLGEDQNLASVGGIGHGLGIADQGGGEDGFAGYVVVGAEGLAMEDGTIL